MYDFVVQIIILYVHRERLQEPVLHRTSMFKHDYELERNGSILYCARSLFNKARLVVKTQERISTIHGDL